MWFDVCSGQEGRGQVIVDELLRFSQSAFSATAVKLTWLQNSGECRDAGELGIGREFLDDYAERGMKCDPLGPKVLVAEPEKVHSLLDLQMGCDLQLELNNYMAFLRRYGYSDELDLVFSDGGMPIAALTILYCQKRFALDVPNFCALRRFLHHAISNHPYARKRARYLAYSERFKLTQREAEVVELIREGASNADIAEYLEIGVATVKTHVVRVLDKVCAESRSALIAITNQL